MAHVNPQEIRIIREEAKDVAFLAHGRLEIQTVSRDGMRRLVERPSDVQSGSLGPSRHSPGATEPIAKCVASDRAIRLSGTGEVD